MEWLALGLIGLFTSLVGAGLNYSAASEANTFNKEIATEQNRLAEQTLNYNKEQDAAVLDYNKWLNMTQMEREDTAVSRRMADLKAAGLSPLLAAGEAATSGAGGTLSRNQTSAPDFQSVNFQNPFSGFSSLGQDLYNSAIKGYAEYNQAEKNKAEVALLNSQTDAKNIENSWLENKLFDESEQRFMKLQQARADIALTASKLTGQERENYLKAVKGYQVYLDNQIKSVQLSILKHDADIVNSSVYPSQVILSGLSSDINNSAFDFKKLNHWEGQTHNYGAGASENIEIPNIKTLEEKGIQETEMLEDGSMVYGNYYPTGYFKDGNYYAGNGYKIMPDNTMWYGQYQVDPNYVDAAKAMLGTFNASHLPKEIMLYSLKKTSYSDGRHDERNRQDSYESYNYSDYNLMH